MNHTFNNSGLIADFMGKYERDTTKDGSNV